MDQKKSIPPSREKQLQNQIAMYRRQPRVNNQRIIDRIQQELKRIRRVKPKRKTRVKKFTKTSRINPKRRTGLVRKKPKPAPVTDPNKAKRQQLKSEIAKFSARISGDHGRGRMFVVRVRRKIAKLRDQLSKLKPIKQKRAKQKSVAPLRRGRRRK